MSYEPLLLTYNGETKSYSEWSAQFNLKTGVLRTRIRQGWSVERALTEPAIKRRSQRVVLDHLLNPLG